ncbi:MAG TPA: riboflavin biosynthesis protein RibF [Opitutaceae bacterium]|nr:riboflavin biosynthesis protein RibF [Opitutaceae bacterium]
MSLSPQLFHSLSAVRLPAQPLHLAIGMFDGVHLGHQAVIESAQHSARREGGLAGVLTFDPHPSRLFRPENPVRLLMPVELKTRFLRERLGIDFVVQEPFTRELAAIEAEDFLPHLRRALPNLHALYVGENWRYGARRRGDAASLVRAGREAGVRVFSAPRINLDGEPISSTRIRAHVAAGEIAAANALFGYAYFAVGRAWPGRRLGRTLGFPTLNLPWAPECAPAAGVYAVRIRGLAEGPERARPGVANYGVRPTVEAAAVRPLLEVHVLGDCPWTEGDELHVEWLEFLRAEQKFDNLEALRVQIARDCEAAETFLRSAI